MRELLSKAGLDKVKLEIVKAEYGAGSTQKDVTAVLRKQAGDLPLITLGFGELQRQLWRRPGAGKRQAIEDPIPDQRQAGEASFAEDALIVLPMPK